MLGSTLCPLPTKLFLAVSVRLAYSASGVVDACTDVLAWNCPWCQGRTSCPSFHVDTASASPSPAKTLSTNSNCRQMFVLGACAIAA